MRKHTIAAVHYSTRGQCKITAAVITHDIQRTVTKQTIEVFFIIRNMTREGFTIFMIEKRILLVLPLLFYRHRIIHPSNKINAP